MTCGIYEIWINDYFYQGSSKNIEQRIVSHKRQLKKSRHVNPKMQSVYNKYNTFEYQILVECDEVALLKWEQDYIDANWGDNKYLNVSPFANKPPSALGVKRSNKTKQKMSESKNPKGYYLHKASQKFHVVFRYNFKKVSVGYYDTEAEARQAYLDAKAKLNIIVS